MVASLCEECTRLRYSNVLIPFIAGQWSLHDPIRIGLDLFQVLIPFIAGQWSLRFDHHTADLGADRVLIPFIAGQWSLPVALAVAALAVWRS